MAPPAPEVAKARPQATRRSAYSRTEGRFVWGLPGPRGDALYRVLGDSESLAAVAGRAVPDQVGRGSSRGNPGGSPHRRRGSGRATASPSRAGALDGRAGGCTGPPPPQPAQRPAGRAPPPRVL